MESGVSEEQSGEPHEGEEDFGLDELEDAFADLRAVLVQPAAPDVAAMHLARMESAALGGVAATAAAPATRHTAVTDGFWTMPRKLAAAVAAVAIGVFGLGGLGMAGALPGPVQDFVATLTDPLGLDMPRSDDPAPSGGQKGSEPSVTQPGQGSGATLAPGQTGETPGQSGETPANGSEPPGLSGSTPGHCTRPDGRQPVGHRTRTGRQPVRDRTRSVRERWRERQRERERQDRQPVGHRPRPRLTLPTVSPPTQRIRHGQ
jgi:hypothetical protein